MALPDSPLACIRCAGAIFGRSSALGRPMNRLVQNVERLIRPHPATATVHDYHDELTPVLAALLRKRAPGYTKLANLGR